MAMFPNMTAKGFMLRPFRKGDERSLRKNVNNYNIYRYTGLIPHPYKMKHARQWIKSSAALNNRRKATELRLAIVMGSEVVGGLGLRNIEGHKAELGYWLAEQHWGKGIMSKAVKLVCNFGFNKLKLQRIYATVFIQNKASARVLEKMGFKFEGILHKYHQKDGRLIDALMYAKVK